MSNYDGKQPVTEQQAGYPALLERIRKSQFVVCVKNDDYITSFDVRKIYRTLPDVQAAQHGLIRVIDESGEDYLYSQDYFMPIELPQPLVNALAWAA